MKSGKPPSQIEREWNSRELQEAVAYDEIIAPYQSEWIQTAQICTTFDRVMGGKSKLLDFIPKKHKEQTIEDQKAIFEQAAKICR